MEYRDIDARVEQLAAEFKASGKSFDPISHADAEEISRSVVSREMVHAAVAKQRERAAKEFFEKPLDVQVIEAHKQIVAQSEVIQAQGNDLNKAKARELYLCGQLDKANREIRCLTSPTIEHRIEFDGPSPAVCKVVPALRLGLLLKRRICWFRKG